jgi:hypothetical protein
MTGPFLMIWQSLMDVSRYPIPPTMAHTGCIPQSQSSDPPEPSNNHRRMRDYHRSRNRYTAQRHCEAGQWQLRLFYCLLVA